VSELLVQARGQGVELWTFKGAARRNTLTRALVGELREAVERTSCRAVVLTGEGDRAFSAGADLKERQGMTESEVIAFLDQLRLLMSGLERGRAIFIAALNGSAYGGGTELALACDLRIASEGIELALTEVTLAIIPGAGGTQRLTRLAGPGVAKDLILTGRRVPAAEAMSLGLVQRLAATGGAVAESLGLAERIASNGPLAVAAAKAAIQGGLDLPLEKGLDIERREYLKTLSSQDRTEGLRAFQEKRPPVYRGA
jgi:enoyl-CoA hydratase/carnithine racemase